MLLLLPDAVAVQVSPVKAGVVAVKQPVEKAGGVYRAYVKLAESAAVRMTIMNPGVSAESLLRMHEDKWDAVQAAMSRKFPENKATDPKDMYLASFLNTVHGIHAQQATEAMTQAECDAVMTKTHQTATENKARAAAVAAAPPVRSCGPVYQANGVVVAGMAPNAVDAVKRTLEQMRQDAAASSPSFTTSGPLEVTGLVSADGQVKYSSCPKFTVKGVCKKTVTPIQLADGSEAYRCNSGHVETTFHNSWKIVMVGHEVWDAGLIKTEFLLFDDGMMPLVSGLDYDSFSQLTVTEQQRMYAKLKAMTVQLTVKVEHNKAQVSGGKARVL